MNETKKRNETKKKRQKKKRIMIMEKKRKGWEYEGAEVEVEDDDGEEFVAKFAFAFHARIVAGVYRHVSRCKNLRDQQMIYI